MNIHLIAIGGSAMHNMALALHHKGFNVTGSDDEIFEPSKSRLDKAGILPKEWGWFPEKINSQLDAIILGMHARIDNPELLKAQELGLKIYSYPEYLYEQTKDKIRVVIGGSHGKTTTTAMIMHVLIENNIDFDYMVGAQLDGFDTMVKLTKEAKIAIFEGDEYLSSPIDRRPKFHLYNPHIALLTGIAWDHINVFPTFDFYLEQFSIFAEKVQENGRLIYFEEDEHLQKIMGETRSDIKQIPYKCHEHKIENNKSILLTGEEDYPLEIFGTHNLQNLEGAHKVCCELGISDANFYSAIKTFGGAAKRLQKLKESDTSTVFLDFAHSPSKLKATTEAVKAQFPNRELVACMELHTFSSLKKDFLPQYENTMKYADKAYVYFSPETIKHKKLENISTQQVADAFASENVEVFTRSYELVQKLKRTNWENKNLLIMTSGNFNGLNLKAIAEELI